MSNANERLWEFAVRTYRSPGTAEACLGMQNVFGADVNMLLFVCWAGARTERFDADLLERAATFSALWAERVVEPLRGARSWMKSSGCSLDAVDHDGCLTAREEIKRVELATEKLQLEALESIASGVVADPAGRLVDNVVDYMRAYATRAGIALEGDALDLWSRIAAAAHPGIDPEEFSAAVQSRSRPPSTRM